MSVFEIRPAKRSDVADLVILENLASRVLANWFWQGAVKMGKAEDAFVWGRQRLLREDSDFSYKCANVAVDSDEVLGAIIHYKMEPADNSKMPPQMAPVLDLFSCVIGDWFVDSLAVYPDKRGQGVGARLLDTAVERAKADELPRVSLVAEDSNETALSLYKSRGFQVQQSREHISFGLNTNTKNWLLLTKQVP